MKRDGSDFQATIELPEDWEVGVAPKGGVNFTAFKRILGQVERYNRKIGKKGPKVALKDLVSQDLRPGIEGRCGFKPDIWNEEDEEVAPGISDADFIAKLKRVLRPERKADFKSAFEAMKIEDRGTKGAALLSALETWGTKWLSKEREAEQAGVVIPSAWLKIAFKDAVEGVYRFKRWLKGRSWPSQRGSATWFKLLCDKLKKKVSKDEDDEREAREEKRRRWHSGDDDHSGYRSRGNQGNGGGQGGGSGNSSNKGGSNRGNHGGGSSWSHEGGRGSNSMWNRGRGGSWNNGAGRGSGNSDRGGEPDRGYSREGAGANSAWQ